MTPSMYVVRSAHICQSLREWAGVVGGMARTGSTGMIEERSEELGRKAALVCLCVCVCVFRTPAATEKPNTQYLLWKN